MKVAVLVLAIIGASFAAVSGLWSVTDDPAVVIRGQWRGWVCNR